MKMGTLSFKMVCSCFVLAMFWLVLIPVYAQQQGASPMIDQHFSGPFTHQNLTIFLIHGPDRIHGKNFLTLQEALEQKKIVVYETGSVNELAVENLSQDEDVFIQSGEIVKGGQQDRVLAFDFIVPPKSGKMPISSFCVEHGRWSKRGTEDVRQFTSSNDNISTKNLKLAAKQKANQSEVWNEVANTQTKLSENVGGSVNSQTSSTSLQLSLEDKKVQATIQEYLAKLEPLISGKPDVIGYAFAINGKVNSADVYASHQLFAKLWPKLIKSSAVEAIAELQKGKKFDAPTVETVKSTLAEAAKAKPSEKGITKRVKMVTRESDKNVVFETYDETNKDVSLHSNYVVK